MSPWQHHPSARVCLPPDDFFASVIVMIKKRRRTFHLFLSFFFLFFFWLASNILQTNGQAEGDNGRCGQYSCASPLEDKHTLCVCVLLHVCVWLCGSVKGRERVERATCLFFSFSALDASLLYRIIIIIKIIIFSFFFSSFSSLAYIYNNCGGKSRFINSFQEPPPSQQPTRPALGTLYPGAHRSELSYYYYCSRATIYYTE